VIKLVIGSSLHEPRLCEAATSEHRAITSSFSTGLIIPRVEITFAAVLSVVSQSALPSLAGGGLLDKLVLEPESASYQPGWDRFTDPPAQPFGRT
jgi:hypothetical protein